METLPQIPIIAIVPTDDEELQKHIKAETVQKMNAKDTFFFHRTEPYEGIHRRIEDIYGEDMITSHMDKNSVLKRPIDMDSIVDEMVRDIRIILKRKGAVLVEIFTSNKIALEYRKHLPDFFKECTIISIAPLAETDKLIYGYIYSGRFFDTKEKDFELNFNKIHKIKV